MPKPPVTGRDIVALMTNGEVKTLLRRIFVLVIAMTCLAATASLGLEAEQTGGCRPRVVVIPFDDQSRYAWEYGVRGIREALCEQLSTELVNSGRFDVYERRMLDKIAKEHGLELSGMIDPSTAVQVGKLTGCQFIACGTIMGANCKTFTEKDMEGNTEYWTRADVTVNYKVVDAETGQVWKQDSVTGKRTGSGNVSEDSLLKQAALETAGEFAHDLLPTLRGRVIEVSDKGFVVNLGSECDIAAYEMRVSGGGEPIKDPATGEVIGTRVGTGKTVLAHPTQVQPKMCYAMPGYWKKVKRFLGSRWDWRADPTMLKDVKVGDEVIAAAPEH